MAGRDETVYIVILHYNNFRCTDFCLASLRQVTGVAFKIVLVDNASTDGSYELVLKKYPECYGIHNEENIGFARGTNVGLRYAMDQQAEYLMLLNNDVEVTPNFLEPMIQAIQKDLKIGIVTPKILYRQDPGLIWHAGGYINRSSISGIARGYNERDEGQYDTPTYTEWASGACCLCSRVMLERVNLCNEAYFFGQEEWDLSASAIREGYKIYYEPTSVVYHEIGQSSYKSPSLYAYQLTYNKYTFARKFLSNFSFYWFVFRYTIYLILFFPKRQLHSAENSTLFFLRHAKKAALWGVRDFFRDIYITEARLNTIDKALKDREH